jgi:hypothetical protein
MGTRPDIYTASSSQEGISDEFRLRKVSAVIGIANRPSQSLGVKTLVKVCSISIRSTWHSPLLDLRPIDWSGVSIKPLDGLCVTEIYADPVRPPLFAQAVRSNALLSRRLPVDIR